MRGGVKSEALEMQTAHHRLDSGSRYSIRYAVDLVETGLVLNVDRMVDSRRRDVLAAGFGLDVDVDRCGGYVLRMRRGCVQSNAMDSIVDVIRLETKIQTGMEQLEKLNYRVFVEIEQKIRWQGV